MPPTRSTRLGFLMMLSSSVPCAVAISCTPRCEMVRAACVSASVPISSITTTCKHACVAHTVENLHGMLVHRPRDSPHAAVQSLDTLPPAQAWIRRIVRSKFETRLRHVVLDRLDHDLVLAVRGRDLHAPRAPDARMRHVTIAADLVARVADDDALADRAREQPGYLADRGRLADACAARAALIAI
jgi:hypothetical protein